MDVESRFLRAMAQAIDDYFMGAGPKPDDKAILAIAPELACLLASPKELEEEEENAVSEQRWIPVSERLPPFGKEMLTFGSLGRVIGYLSDNGKWFSCHCDNETGEPWLCDPGTVTHWMPLPEPPEGTL